MKPDLMKKLVFLLLASLISLNILGQDLKRVSFYVNGNWSQIIYDRINEGAGGFTLGLDLLIHTKTKFSPRIEANYCIFSVLDDYQETLDGYPYVSMDHGPLIFAGLTYQPVKQFSISFSPGLSYFNSRPYFAIKPSAELCLDKKKRFLIKASLTNIFIDDHAGNQPEGIINLGLSIKLI